MRFTKQNHRDLVIVEILNEMAKHHRTNISERELVKMCNHPLDYDGKWSIKSEVRA